MKRGLHTRFGFQLLCGMLAFALQLVGVRVFAETESDPAHVDAHAEKPSPWPRGVIPYDISKLTDEQAVNAKRAMQLWMETGADIQFIPHTSETEYVYFTGKTDAGNNTPFVGFRNGM